MKRILLIATALILAGCASDQTVTVGAPGQKGIVRHQIDRSRSVAAEASQQVGQDNKDLGGG